MSARYNCEVVSVETGEEDQRLWLTRNQVVDLIYDMKPGDDLVVHRTDQDADDRAIYP